MVALATALLKAGHTVRFATSSPLDEAIRHDGFEVETVGLSVAEIGEAREKDPTWTDSAGRRMRMVAFTKSFASFEVPPRLAGLRRVIQTWRPSLLIHETSEFAGPLAGALEDVPTVNHSFGLLVEADVMAAASDAAARHWLDNGLSAPDRGGMYGRLYLDIAPPSLQYPHITSVTSVQPLRPVPLQLTTDEPPEWLSKLGRSPVVTVTFGTVFNNRIDLYRAVIDGLAETDLDVVIASGRSEAAKALVTLPPNIQVHEWVPWSLLLAHSAVVVSHGGASSTLGPLSFGLPLVVIPLGADHFTNAGLMSSAGAAIVLEAETVTPTALRDAVTTALVGPPRTAARRIGAEIAEMPAPEAVVPVLTELVA